MKKQVNIRLEEKIRDKADKAAKKVGMSRTSWLTMLILMGVRDEHQ